MSAVHRAHRQWTPERLIHWGQSIGVATGAAVARMLSERRHPEHGYRVFLGLLSLVKRYGQARVEAAYQAVIRLSRPTIGCGSNALARPGRKSPDSKPARRPEAFQHPRSLPVNE